MTLIIDADDVKELLTFEETISALEEAYRQYGLGLAGGNSLIFGSPVVPRTEMRVEGKELVHISPKIRAVNQTMAYLEETGKVVTRFSFHLGNKRAQMDFLIDAKSGEILAIIRPRPIMGMRVGSEGAIGAKYLSRKDSCIAGMIGVGNVGRYLLTAICKVRKIEKVFVYAGRKVDFPLAQKYAKDMNEQLGIDITVCEGAEEVVRKADILTTATLSTTPIVKGEWVSEGLHINAIGADDTIKAELDASTLKKADKLVIDYDLSLDTKEIRVPMEQGLLNMDDIYGNIGEIVSGVKQGRTSPSEITIFKDTGMTLPYVTIYTKVYENAVKKGLGKELDKSFLDLLYM